MTLFTNPIFYGLIAVFLGVYGPHLHPRLPDSIRRLFEQSWFRFAVILLVTFVSTKDLTLALLISIAFVLLLSTFHNQQVHETFMIRVTERFTGSSNEQVDEEAKKEETFEDKPEEPKVHAVTPEQCQSMCASVKKGDANFEFCSAHSLLPKPLEEKFSDYVPEDAETYENYLRQVVDTYKFRM